MAYLRFWTIITLVMAACVSFFKDMLLHEGWGEFVNPFARAMPVAFNNVGVIFGVASVMLWTGKISPFSNKTAFFLLIIGAFSYVLQALIDPLQASAGQLMAVFFWPMGAASLIYCAYTIVSAYILKTNKKVQDREYVFNYFSWVLIIVAMGIATGGGLTSSMFVWPATIDFDLYKIDMAFNGFSGWLFDSFQEYKYPLWQTIVETVYGLLSIFLLLSLGPVFRERRGVQLHALRTLIVPFGVAFTLYSITPVAGPHYVFGNAYPNEIDWSMIAEKGRNLVSPSLRNGMPSMHFTGAMLLVLVAACLSRKVWFYVACCFAAITFIATMALGEHYLLDLIVAMPFCIALGTALINPPGWQFWQRRIWWICTLIFVVWELGLHFDMSRFFFVDHLNFVRVFSLVSVAVAIWGFAAFLRVVWKLPAPTEAELQASLAGIKMQKSAASLSMRWVYGLFVCSGFAGLLYEVVFAKHLGVIFGGTALAAYTVMATYMGGMALGAWLGGIIADRVRAPLKWYALFEAAIGIYALATPALFKLIEQVYVALATDVRPDAPSLTFWRVALGALVLGIPTLLMGTTLPLMFKFLRGYLASRGRIISRLYTANIIGAALGALAGAYVVLPTFGLLSSTRLAALLSLMIALYALDRLKALPAENTADSTASTASLPADAADEESGYAVLPPQDAGQRRRLGLAALLLVTVGGVVSLALEIVNMHMLAVVAGNSVYAFGLMLATFLLGLGLGSIFYDKLRHLLTDPAVAAIAQLGIFFTIVISAFRWEGLATYLGTFGFMQEFLHIDFGASEVIRGSVCAIIMMPPAFFIGLGYPATMALAADWLKKRGEATGLGIASLCNTLGNIAGVLLAGFVFLNWLGSNRLLFALAIISLLLALYMAWVGRLAWPLLFNQHRGRQYFATAITALAIAVALWGYPPQWNLEVITSGAKVYFVPSDLGEVIDSKENVQDGLITVHRKEIKDAKGKKRTMQTLMTNGVFQGDDFLELEAQKAFAQVPLLHQPERDHALVIGYGTGHTARELHDAGFARMDIAELSPDIVTLADRHFGDINGKVSQQANVQMYYSDGRNYLLTQDRRYDLISVDITGIWLTGGADFYNREFYQLAKARLNDDGVLQQWVQLHHMQPLDLLYILNTLHQEFRYVWLYVIGGQGVLVASNVLEAQYNTDANMAVTKGDVAALQDHIVLEPADFVYLAQKLRIPQFFVSTDNNRYLEYSTPKGNAADFDTFASNIEMLEKIHSERLERDAKLISNP
ncbi:fused MFS/spermidine synthase [Cardiobacterium hominis]|uniref:fused MFS/spermidine synthase n=1 Tax=Cardiobacterium hominis TaxID=2718 RepID=UPI0028F0420D|nr:fused MFS/spermidine synthase [Cardiobacterium hominis]